MHRALGIGGERRGRRYSRLGRRVAGLFVLSALVPLGLCAAFLFREFTADLVHTRQQHLDALVRSYGMTLLGRLGSADDVMRIVLTGGASDAEQIAKLAQLSWIRGVTRVSASAESTMPKPDRAQQRALGEGSAVVLWTRDDRGSALVYLLRSLPSGAWLYASLDPKWLWGDLQEFAGDARLTVAAPGVLLATAGAAHPTAADAHGALLSGAWELPLEPRYASPAWRLIASGARPTLLSSPSAYGYLVALSLLTLLFIAVISILSIRRQLRPLELLTLATRRVAQRDFDAFRGLQWDDEFGDLARAFDAMSAKLKTQFGALETLAEVDRLLLAAPALELILDTLLPRIAELLQCDSVSVLLFDPDSDEHARAYDYYPAQPQQWPVRRIAIDVAALKAASESTLPLIQVDDVGPVPYLAANAPVKIATLRLQALKNDGQCVGALSTGYAAGSPGREDAGVGASDFADRLSMILANLRQSERLRRQANYDSLTGLQNRHQFSESVRAAVIAARAADGMGALLYIDLDHFKLVNDTAGHAAGDGLLRVVAQRLGACGRDEYSIARLGGDEFAVLLPRIADPDVARRLGETILGSLRTPIVVDGREHQVSASIGMTVFPADGDALEELLKAGDIAMYHAKDLGRGCAVFFQSEMQEKLLERLKMESGMHRAFQRRDFTLHYQPIVSEAAGGALSVEALVRWPGANQGPWIAPGVFVPIAEENGLIVKLGDWILRTACEQFSRWRAAGLWLDYISVNVSVRQLREPDFLAILTAALKDNGMQGRQLQLEITESVLAHGAEVASALNNIAAAGVRLALDDFGTGYSSLSYLRSYPIDTVKIDRSFVLGLPHDVAACRLAESIIVMCATLGKSVVAEGVETEAQQQFLRRAGCTTVQGYLLGRPMEAADIPGFARRLRSTVRQESGAEGGARERDERITG